MTFVTGNGVAVAQTSKFSILFYFCGLSWLLTMQIWPQNVLPDSQLILKVARCEGDHVDISNSGSSSDSAEESFILLNQMVLAECVPCSLQMLL